MTIGIEVLYNKENPFFMQTPEWRRAEASGNANILFHEYQVARELTPLYNFWTYNFFKIVNRTNKILIRTDISGVIHASPTLPANDGLGIHNQEGTAVETFNSPPFSLGILWPQIEQYKKQHLELFGVQDAGSNLASFLGYPNVTKEQARAIREYFNAAREGDGGNPGGKSLSLSQNNFMVEYGDWPRKLMMSPDSDYPDGNLLQNPNFDGLQVYNSDFGYYIPEKWITEFNPSELSATFYYPHLAEDNGQNVITMLSGYSGFDPPTAGNVFNWNWYGVYQKFICTPIWQREVDSPSRYRHKFDSFSGLTIDTPISTGVENIFFDLSEDYFSEVVYSHYSYDDYNLWETDRNTDQAEWFNFTPDGSISEIYGTTTKVRHELGDPTNLSGLFKQYFSKFKGRYRRTNGIDEGYTWTDWAYTDVSIPSTSPVIVTPLISLGSTSAPSYFQYQLGNIGGRGNTFRLKFDKSIGSGSLFKTIIDSNLDNRKIYAGDLFTYEVLVDELSVDSGFCIRLGLVNEKTDLDEDITYTTIQFPLTKNTWEKIELDLTPYIDKYVRRIEIGFISTNNVVGACLGYFNEVQCLNWFDRFCGRQFMVSARYKSDNLVANPFTSNPFFSDWHKPELRYYMKTKDQFGTEDYQLAFMHQMGEADTEDEYRWIKGITQFPYNNNCIEIGVGIGLLRNVPEIHGGPYGPIANGGSLTIERMSLEPTSRMYFAGVYSLDTGIGNDTYGDNHFLPIDQFGWKAWALQVRAKYFSAWEGL